MDKQPDKQALTLKRLPFGSDHLRGLDSRSASPYPFPAIPVTKPRFGLLFPELVTVPENKLPVTATGQMDPEIVAALDQLGGEMRDSSPADPAGDNPGIPAAYTYLGQFIDHDLTLDLTSILTQLNDPSALTNFRDPAFNLDSLYGAGPGVEAFLYDKDSPGQAKIIRRDSAPTSNDPKRLYDLQRNQQDIAILPEARNDENLIVAQVHVAFARFHNRVVRDLAVSPSSLFGIAARKVVLHYQWMIVNDFLPRFIDPALITSLLDGTLSPLYKPEGTAFMPVEFSAAAYRLGHTMVRENYNFNAGFPNASLAELFGFTRQPVPDNWNIDWSRLLATDATAPHNFARKFDPRIVPGLHNISVGGNSFDLAKRNLQRGYALGLPTGQAVATTLGATLLSPAELVQGFPGTVFTDFPILLERTPLWYYILQESSVRENGHKLGPVGQRIVAEVFVGILKADPSSYLKIPGWKPSLGATQGQFTLSDLITVALTE
jgi:hypothetical protein